MNEQFEQILESFTNGQYTQFVSQFHALHDIHKADFIAWFATLTNDESSRLARMMISYFTLDVARRGKE